MGQALNVVDRPRRICGRPVMRRGPAFLRAEAEAVTIQRLAGSLHETEASTTFPLAGACGSAGSTLTAPGATWSAAERLARQHDLALALVAAGVKRGDVVAIMAQRTPDTIAAICAVVGLGAAYLPLDPQYPQERLAHMLSVARPSLVLGRADLLAGLRGLAIPSLALESVPAGATGKLPDFIDDDDALAYVLFTSGSTGQPKGVAMRRGAVARLLDWHVAHRRLGHAARTLQFAPLGFDVSFQEIFSTFATGGSLVLPSDSERRDPFALLELLRRERIERLFLPYVALQALAEAVMAGGALPLTLRDVVTAGEQLRITPAIRALFAALPECMLHNHYGPTETHVVTAHELSGDPAGWPELPPIGAALPHVLVRVVDAQLAEVADGEEGELLLGGECLAAGYIQRADLTAERFVERDGRRWYRSGDRVRDLGAGVLDCLGRLDQQIKLDGYRVEPGEIESVLGRHPSVAEAVVVAADSAVGRRLVAHVVARDNRVDDVQLVAQWRAHCEAMLAPYLVPQSFILHAALPQTASGKIDRRALAEAVDPVAFAWIEDAPLDQQLLAMWQQLLGADELRADDNLFDFGARSLTVVHALTELRRHGYREISAVQIYEHSSVAKQATLLRAGAGAVPVAALDARAARQRAALSRFAPRGGSAP